jgi:hypothetical protein
MLEILLVAPPFLVADLPATNTRPVAVWLAGLLALGLAARDAGSTTRFGCLGVWLIAWSDDIAVA